MIPIPWRLIGIAAAVLLLTVMGLTINGWRLDSRELKAARQALKAEIECLQGTHCQRERMLARERALDEAEATLREEQRLNLERENAYQAKLAESDRHYRDAAARLAALRVCPKVPKAAAPAAPAGEPVAAGPVEPGDGESIAGLGPILRDCEADAAQLSEVQLWYAGLRRIRNAEIEHGRQP